MDKTAKPGRGRLLQFSGRGGGDRAGDDYGAARLAVAIRRAAPQGHASSSSHIRRCFQHVDLCGLADSFEREANAEPGSTDLLPSPGSTDCGAACPYRTPWWIPQRRKRAGLDLRASRLGSFSMET